MEARTSLAPCWNAQALTLDNTTRWPWCSRDASVRASTQEKKTLRASMRAQREWSARTKSNQKWRPSIFGNQCPSTRHVSPPSRCCLSLSLQPRALVLSVQDARAHVTRGHRKLNCCMPFSEKLLNELSNFFCNSSFCPLTR